MSVATLKRIEPKASPTSIVFDASCEELGYIPRPSSIGVCSRAAAIFQEAGVRPFDRATVDRYKEKVLYQKNWWFLKWVMAVGLILVAIPATLAIVYNSPLCLLGLIGSAILTAIFAGICAAHTIQQTWTSDYLRNYAQAVPEYALQTALDVRRAAGAGESVSIWVEFLKESPRSDPFLVVRIDGNSYYLEVWDEPDFFSKRRV